MAEIMAAVACGCVVVAMVIYIYNELKSIDNVLEGAKKGAKKGAE